MKYLHERYGKVRLLTILAMMLTVLTYVASQKNSAQSSSCLTSQWSAEGNANDNSALNPGMLRGGVTFAPGQTGQAFSLDGSTGYVEVPINSAVMNSPISFTWEARVNPSSLNNPVIFQKGAAVFDRAGLQILSDGSLCTYLNSSHCRAISAPGIIQTGQFTKVTMLYDAAAQELRTYANNVQVTSVSLSGPYSNNDPFIIGFSMTPLSYDAHFEGLIDEVSFSSCAMPPSPAPTTCSSTTVTVPGTANPWLSGMPSGSTDAGNDSLPAESPVQVNRIPITGGQQYTFKATGYASNCPPTCMGAQPDGIDLQPQLHFAGAVNGIAQLNAPLVAVVGVFLDDVQPDLTSAPSGLDFYASPLDRNYVNLSPALKQPFFIGDGKTSAGTIQTIIAPSGATRLFLGAMDGGGWYNNVGAYGVTVSSNQSPEVPCEPGPTVDCVNPSSAIVSRWSGEENANDSVGSSTGTLQTGVSFAPGKFGQAFSFDGASYVSIAGSPALSPSNEVTLDAWFTAENTGGSQELISKFNHSSGYYSFYVGLSNGAIVFRLETTSNVSDNLLSATPTSASVYDGQLHHFAATYNGNQMKIYFDGALIGSQPASGAIFTNSTNVLLGADFYNYNPSNFHKGLLDEVEIYNRALCASDIAAIYAGQQTPAPTPATCNSTPSAVSRWLADGNANDSIGGNNGALQFGATFGPGVSGQAFSLDGVDDYVDLPNDVTLNPCGSFTWDAWIDPTSLSTAPVVMTKETGTSNRIGLQVFADGSMCGYFDHDNCDAHSDACVVKIGTYTHVAMVFDHTANEMRLYANGSLVAIGPKSFPPSVSAADLNIGSSPLSGHYFNGLIDQVEVQNRALTISEIAGIYNTNTPAGNPAGSCGATPTPTITGGLPPDGGIYGPGDGATNGRVTRTITGTGNPGCIVKTTVSDPDHPQLAENNTSYSLPVDASGNWSLSLTLYDCDPVVDIVQVCDGSDSAHITRHVYVDGTPPHFTSGGPGDGLTYTGGGGTGHIVLSGGASDAGTHVPGGGITYGWKLIGGGIGGADLVLGGGGSAGILTGGGGGLEIDLPPGDYDFEEQVCDTAGNCFTKRCHRRVCRRLTVTSGLPGDEGIYGPGDGITIGKVTRLVKGTGNPGCTVQVAVTDPAHPQLADNNKTYTVPVDTSGNWSLPLTLDDCDPVVTITEICDGIGDTGDVIRQHVYVDGRPPTVGLGGGTIYVGTGGTGGIILDADAGDGHSFVPNNGLRYDWYVLGGGGGGLRTLLCGGCPGTYSINEPAGEYDFEVVVTDAAGNQTTKRCHRTVLKRPTAITYTGDVLVANGGTATLQGVLTDITPPLDPTPVPVVGRTVTLRLGSGPTAQSCTGITDSTGFVRCTVSPVNQLLGPGGIATDVFAGDDTYLPSNNGAQMTVFAFATGSFVIGDLNAVVGNQVTFWGAQWAKQNSLSGGSASNSFKGFENQSSTTPPMCGGTWTTDPGNSSGPPASIPSYMGVIVSSSITKSGSNIAGNIVQIVIVKTDPGYASNPGHAGTGTVVAVFCK